MSEPAEVKIEKSQEEQWAEVLDYAEKSGQENIKFHIENGDCIAKESNTTLTILLAGGGATLGYWMKLLELKGHTDLSWGVAVLSFYLFTLAFVLLFCGMEAEDLEAPTNEPVNLLLEGFSANAIREEDLRDLQRRIKLNIARNARKAWWLNLFRRSLICAPIVFSLGMCVGLLVTGQ